MATEHLLEVTGLAKSYGHHAVLRDVSFSLRAGERLALIGPSGSGKSTCLRAINYLDPPTAGDIRLSGATIGRRGDGRRMNDRELAPQRAEIGMVFQHFHLWPHLSVRANVALQPRRVRGVAFAKASALAEAMLAKVHLGHKVDDMPERLSGGQQQRVAIARALAQQPKLLLFDEPTSALDPELVGEVLRVMRALAEEGRTMLVVTHEMGFARDVSSRVVFLHQGVVEEDGKPQEVFANSRSERFRQFISK
jgi:polar amino acid transport system ATP-binding protein